MKVYTDRDYSGFWINCRMVSCEENWRNIQNLIVSYTGICVKNCKATGYQYLFKGKCYSNCPVNTTNNNFICYSNSLLEKCENYSIESDFENLCIKCKNNYYPILNDKNIVINMVSLIAIK